MLKLQPVSNASHKGTRSYQEDRLIVCTCEQGTLLGVFDGHGGAQVSQLVSEEIPSIFSLFIDEPAATVQQVLKYTVETINSLTQNMQMGSTLSLAFIPVNEPVVYCAVLGDSPIIIKDDKGNFNISPDHNVRTNQAEAEAAIKRGGFVQDGYLGQSFDGAALQMARALGDCELSRVLSREPDIYSVQVNKNSFVMVASDGAFDPGHYNFKESADEVIKLVENGADAQTVVNRAIDIPTHDNVSCIIARFEDTTV